MLSHTPPAPGAETRSATFDVLFHKALHYRHDGHWGFVDTPARRDACTIADKTQEFFPFVAAGSLMELLEHAFDNVANHGVRGMEAKGAVEIGTRGDALVLRISNTCDAPLPERLRGKEIGAEQGTQRLEYEELHAERTGGGNGLHFMTGYLPFLYRSEVATQKSARLAWEQSAECKGGRYDVAFELRIPLPSAEELAPLQKELARREYVAEVIAKAERFFERAERKTELSARDRYTGLELASGVLQLLVESPNREEDESAAGTTDVVACAFLERLGADASSAAALLRTCVLTNVCSYPAEQALRAIEKDPAATLAAFGAVLPELLKEGSKVGSNTLDAILRYAKELGPQAAALGDIIFAERGSKAADTVAAMTADPARLPRILQDLASSDERLARGALTLIGAFDPIPSEAMPALLAKLSDEHLGYHVDELLKRIQPSANEANLLAPLLDPSKKSLYSALQFAQRIPESADLLFDELLTLLPTKEHGYGAAKVLEGRTPTPSDIERIRPLLGSDSASMNYMLEFAARIPGAGQALFGKLVTLLTTEQGYSASQILKEAALTPEQRETVAALVFNHLDESTGSGNVLYRIGEILKTAPLPAEFSRRLAQEARNRKAEGKELPYSARQLLEHASISPDAAH